ncbi:MAG: hypothetical protein AB7E96_11895 [Deferribacterales bacterium]
MASKTSPCQELTEKEKRELALKVYPTLKTVRKKNPIRRLLRFGGGALALLVLCSCAVTAAAPTEPVPQPEQTSIMIKNGMTKADDPKEFEMSMPESEFSLATVYKYSKEPTVVNISSDVIDFDYDKGTMILLKKDRLETNRPECLSINLDGEYSSVLLSGSLALVNGRKKAVLADISRCGTLSETDTNRKGVSLSDTGFLEFTSNSYALYDRYKTNEIFTGTFLGRVIYGQLGKTNMLFATENGKIALIDTATNKFSAITKDSLGIKQINYVDSDIYVYTDENRLIRMQADFGSAEIKEVNKAQGKDGCFLLKKSGYMFCDGYVTGTESAFRSPVGADSGLYTEGLLFLKKDGVLVFVDSELNFRKSVVLGAEDIGKVCLKDGKGYFRDLDRSVKYFTADGSEHVSDKYPENCDHTFNMSEGAVRDSAGKPIYRYADPVNRSIKAVMLKRIIGKDIYYYFEAKK